MKTIISKFNLRLILSSGLMSIYPILIGCVCAFSSSLFAQLENPTSNIKLTSVEASWIASIPLLICPIGLIITGILMDKFGRRFTLQLAYIPLILSWVVLGYADSYKTILIGRIISGITFGSGMCVIVYLAEVSSAKRRTLFNGTLSVSGGIGNITVSALSVFFRWNTVSLLMAAASAAGCASLFLVPESPAWLRCNGRAAEAESAERWYGVTADGGAGAPVADGTTKGTATGTTKGTATGTDVRGPWWHPYARPAVWKPTLLTFGFFACQQCSGTYVLMFYSADVLRDCVVPWDPSAVTVFLFATRMLGGLAFAALFWMRRKTLGVVSCTAMAAALAFVVVVLRLPLDRATRLALGPVVVVAFTVYVFSTQVGMVPMPWSLCGEVFPMDVRGKMTGVVQMCGYMSMFIIIKIYPLMVSTLGIENVWTIFTLFCSLSSLFCIFILPETQGVPLDVILTYFEPRKKPTQSTTITSPQLEV